jgi:hypothetical protein
MSRVIYVARRRDRLVRDDVRTEDVFLHAGGAQEH